MQHILDVDSELAEPMAFPASVSFQKSGVEDMYLVPSAKCFCVPSEDKGEEKRVNNKTMASISSSKLKWVQSFSDCISWLQVTSIGEFISESGIIQIVKQHTWQCSCLSLIYMLVGNWGTRLWTSRTVLFLFELLKKWNEEHACSPISKAWSYEKWLKISQGEEKREDDDIIASNSSSV